MHGYILLYDDKGYVLLQKKAYFQRFSVKRMCFYKQPVCGNPGQFSLPGGSVDEDLVNSTCTLDGALAQFTEECGVTTNNLEKLKYCCRGSYSAPEAGREISSETSVYFTVHFVHVESVKIVATMSTSIIQQVQSMLSASTSNDLDNTILTADQIEYFRSLHASTGYNDDSANSYHMVSFADLIPHLTEELPFEMNNSVEWIDLVMSQKLFASSRRKEKIKKIISNPGHGRDWLIDAAKCFLHTPDVLRIIRELSK